MTLEERFWSKVKKTDHCWEWTASINTTGYGMFFYGHGKTRQAHRIAYELSTGKEIPPGMFACHKCDVRWCVRPDHIFIGTAADNMRDMHEKGRRPKKYRVNNLCRKGHVFSEENTLFDPLGRGNYRRCKTCESAKRLRFIKTRAAKNKLMRGERADS